jgi:hypothetical protein
MIDPENLSFGDVVYAVKETNNAFRKKKIKMIDADGVEWSRYDREQWEYSVDELVYCGRVTFEVTGEVPVSEGHEEEMYFKYPDGSIYSEYYESIAECDRWFPSREQADSCIEELKESRRDD